MELYHYTLTGKDNQNLESYIKTGVKSDVGKPFEQGRGFYLFTNRDLALFNIPLLKDRLLNSGVEGNDMLVVLNESLNPNDYDFDYELNASRISQFLYDHFDSFKSLPDNAIQIDNWNLYPSQSEILNFGIISIGLTFDKGVKGISIPDYDQSIGCGKLYGPIFNCMQKYYPELTKEFEESVFSDPNLVTAIKYKGIRPLKPKIIEIKNGNEWEIY